MITTQKALRAAFWESHPKLKRVPGFKQNQYPADTRMAWCDFVESCTRNWQISDTLANRATL